MAGADDEEDWTGLGLEDGMSEIVGSILTIEEIAQRLRISEQAARAIAASGLRSVLEDPEEPKGLPSSS